MQYKRYSTVVLCLSRTWLWIERELGISEGREQRVQSVYFHILPGELRVNLDQTGGDCGETSRECFGEFYCVYVEAIHLKKRQT